MTDLADRIEALADMIAARNCNGAIIPDPNAAVRQLSADLRLLAMLTAEALREAPRQEKE